jgi:hypothetical protein
MYELSSSTPCGTCRAIWLASRPWLDIFHDASIGNEKFLDWGWNQFIIPVGFELRLVDASVM